jgi:hypothetical protein
MSHRENETKPIAKPDLSCFRATRFGDRILVLQRRRRELTFRGNETRIRCHNTHTPYVVNNVIRKTTNQKSRSQGGFFEKITN